MNGPLRAWLCLALGAAGTASAGCMLEVPDVLPAPESDATVQVPAPDGSRYLVDATEVTRRRYADFLAAAGTDTAVLAPAVCAGDHDATPRDAWQAELDRPDHPVVFVDWCDAAAYCAWGGKRLCGGIGGRAYDGGATGDASVSEWFNACSAGGTQPYPYGDYVAGRCNDAGGGDETLPVREPATCEGGFPGLFGMSGNAREWDAGCSGDDPGSACPVRGGGFRSNPASEGGDLGCFSDFGLERDQADDVTGFRCCADLP